MTTKKKAQASASLDFKIPQDEAYAAADQRAWALAVAEGIKKGELPASALERHVLAAIVRKFADGIKPAKKRGNPAMTRLHDPGSVALVLYARIDIHGQKPQQAFADVAATLGGTEGIDVSTVAKAYRKYRASIKAMIEDGAIRGE